VKAAIFRDFDQPLQLGEIAEPRPAADQLLIRVARCGICGSDLHMTREPAMGIRPGAVLGHEFSGGLGDAGLQGRRSRRCGTCAWVRPLPVLPGGRARLV
jgi:(R,R)-butanediol dehydrogenase / meso-butanediol dehydrogenase / diacetyl reductase